MACGCGRRRGAAGVPAGSKIAGYYVVRPDGTRAPEAGLFMSSLEAGTVRRQSGGGTIYSVKRKRQQ